MAERICRRVDGITITQKKNKNDYSVSQLSALNTDAHISRNISRSSMALACAVVRCGKCERMRRFYARGTATQVKTYYSAFGVVSKLRRNIASFTYKERRNRLTASILTFVMLFQIVAGIFSPVNIFNLDKPMTANASWTSGWEYRKEIKVDHTKVSPTDHTDQTNFPMLVSFTDSSLKSTTNSGKVYNGTYLDIMFTEANGTTKLDWEKESYDPATGELVAWVKIPTLSATNDTSIYIYYGNSAITATQENKTGVWDDGGSNNFKGVWHLGETTRGAEADFKDSTANHNDSVNITNEPVATAGQVDGAESFDGTSQYVATGNGSSLNITSDFTYSTWVKFNNLDYVNNTGTRHIISSKGNPDQAGVNSGWEIVYNNTGNGASFNYTCFGNSVGGWIGGGNNFAGYNYTLSNGVFYNISVTITSSSQAKLYINGQQLGAAKTLSNLQLSDTSNPLQMAHNLQMLYGYVNLDEVRISDTARSADWIATEYNNQSQPTEFSTLGIEEVSSPLSLSSFAYRKAITIDHTKVSGIANLTNFPVLINLPTDDSLAANAQDDNDDILFTSSSIAWNTGTTNDKLAHEIESFNGTTGSLQAWVKVPNISSSNDTVIYMYYGNASATNQQNKTAVWDSNTKMVQHMKETGTNPIVYDSTQYANNSTSQAWSPTTSGQIDGAGSFSGSQYVDVGSGVNLKPDIFTYETWVKYSGPSGSTISSNLMSWGNNQPNILIETGASHLPLIYMGESNYVYFSATTPINIYNNNWHHLVFTVPGSGQNDITNAKLYVDGVQQDTSGVTATGAQNIKSGDLSIGKRGTDYFTGSMDEVRLSDTIRSAEWIATEYNNQSQPTEFSSLGIEEVSVPLSLSSFKYRKAITIDHTKVSGTANLTNFPVLINLPNDASLSVHAQDAAHGNGGDILFTSSTVAWNTGTVNDKLAHEIETYTSATGSLQAWVKIPSLNASNATQDTVIYMYYGHKDNANENRISSQQNKTAVWDSSTKMVQHMNQDPGGIPAQMIDSTQYANNGTSSGGMTVANSVAGQVDGATSFDGSNDYVDCGGGNLNLTNAITVDAWINVSNASTQQYAVFKSASFYLMPGYSDGKTHFRFWDSSGAIKTMHGNVSTFVQPGKYGHVVATYNGTDTKIYINGSQRYSSAVDAGTILNNSSVNLSVGANNTSSGNSFLSGSLDEVRISDTARSADWIATEYNNQSVPLKTESTPTGFLSLSAEQIYQLEIIGSTAQTAGKTQTLTLNAKDASGAIMSNYTGDKTVTFSGANAAPSGTVPTCTDKNNANIALGSPTTLAFTGGVAHCDLKLYKAESAIVTSNISGITTNLLVTVSPDILNNFLVDAPNSSDSGSAFVTTVTSRDAYNNTTKTVTGTTTLSTNYGTLNNTSISQDNFTDDGIWTGNLTIANINEQPSVALTATNGASTGIDNISILGIPNSPAPASASRNTDDSVTLTWKDNSAVETGYKIERKTNDGTGFSPYTQIATVAANTSSFTDTTTIPDRAYQYQVRAYNTIGNSAYAEDAVIHYTTPDTPSNVFSTRNNDTSFTVNYTDNANVTDTHHIQRCSNANCTAAFETDLNTFTSSPQTDTINIAPDSGYRWQVRAEAPSINSNYTVSAFEYTTPNAPVIQDATFISSTQINVNWQDASAYEDGFRIEVSTDGGAYQEITPGTNTVGANSTSYAFVSQADHNYKFRIKSHIGSTPHNPELFSVCSGESAPIYTTSNAPVMQTPIVNSPTSITWNWTDASAFEEAFHLHFIGSGTNVDNIPANTTNYETANLLPNTAYQTHIHSYRTDSGESASSDSPEIYTFAAIPLPPTLALDQQNRITATRATDTNPTATEYLIENVNNSTNSNWITSPSWTTSELHCETEYSFHIKARNHSNIETDYSSLATLKTGSCGTPLPPGSNNPPATPSPTTENPAGGFKMIINNNDAYTKTGNVKLTLSAGADTTRMAISNSKDFSNAFLVPYQKEAIWNLNAAIDNTYTVYAKFYTRYGVASSTVSDTIILDTTAPILNLTDLKDKYLTADNITVKGTTESNSKIIYNLDSIRAGVIDMPDGKLNLNLGILTEGNHSLKLVIQDSLGNSSDTMQFFLNVEKLITVPINPTVPNTSTTPTNSTIQTNPKPTVTPTNPIVTTPTVPQSPISQPDTEAPNTATPNIPNSNTNNPDINNSDTTPPDTTVTPEPPVSMQGDWNLLSIQPFPKDVTSEDIQMIIEKFPEFKDTFKNLGIADFSNADELKNASFNIPGLSEVMGLKSDLTALNLPAVDTPLTELSAQFKKEIPSNIVFVKTKNSNLDVNSVLAFDNGNPDQKISLLSSQSFQLILKPDQEVNSIQGYLTFKESKLSRTESSGVMQKMARLLKPNRASADENIEEKLVLSQFDYRDADQDGIWTADVNTPQVSGEYELITVLNYKDVKVGAKTLRLITVVDPEGYVYRTELDGEKTRISNATISIYRFNSETKKYELWDAGKYQQKNPQTTDDSGTYSFLVPPGSYYLKVEAAGYSAYQSDPFAVTVGSGVHMNLELKRQADWKDRINWQNLLLVVFGVALFYNFYSDRKARKKLKTTEIV